MSIKFFVEILFMFCFRKLFKVVRWTFNLFAILTFEVQFFNRLQIFSSFQVNFFIFVLDPNGRHNFFHSAFLFARASFVL